MLRDGTAGVTVRRACLQPCAVACPLHGASPDRLFPSARGTAVAWPVIVLPCTWPSQKQRFEVVQHSLITQVLLSFSNSRSEVY